MGQSEDLPNADNVTTRDELHRAALRLMGSRRKVRTVARDTGLSASSVSDLRSGRRRLTHNALMAIAGAYAPADTARWEAAWLRVSSAVPPIRPAVVPRELPADPPWFVGRAAQLAELDRLLATADQQPAQPRLLALTGIAGVGKTALAVHWAHLRADAFPDGCLYVDLRGYDPLRPADPADVLAGLLRSLGMADSDQPQDVPERAGRLRTMLASRRLLLLLDNARNAEHARLLLPGAGPCVAIVTARAGLTALRDRFGARHLELHPMPAAESEQLVRALLTVGGGDRLTLDDAVRLVARHCAGLPLALRIAAGAALDSAGGVVEVARDLADDEKRLDLLDSGDPRTAVRSVFSWSLRRLDPPSAATFARLGLHPTAEVGALAIAALSGVPAVEAQRRITVLLRARLLAERAPGRLVLHDLLRDYARELVATEPEPDRRAAVARLRAYYLHGAVRARAQLGPLPPWSPPEPDGVTELPRPADAAEALEWLEAERPALMAMLASASGPDAWPWICAVTDHLALPVEQRPSP